MLHIILKSRHTLIICTSQKKSNQISQWIFHEF